MQQDVNHSCASRTYKHTLYSIGYRRPLASPCCGRRRLVIRTFSIHPLCKQPQVVLLEDNAAPGDR
jgi:hypothetical protein